MTQFQRKKIQEEIERQNAKADAEADKLLDKVKAWPWTGAVLIFVATIIVIAAFNFIF